MFRFGSLKTRILVLTTIPISVLFVSILIGTIHTANNAVGSSVRRSLGDAGDVFVQLLSTRRDELLSMTRVTVRDPRFFATFSIPSSERGDEFSPTLAGIARDFLHITDADFLEIFDASGTFLTSVQRDGSAFPVHSAGVDGLAEAAKGYAVTDFYEAGGHLAIASIAPIYVSQQLEGFVRLGSFLNDAFAEEVKRLTGADVCLARSGEKVASTFPRVDPPHDWVTAADAGMSIREGAFTLSEAFTLDRSDTRYLAIHVRVNGVGRTDGFDAFIARELRKELAPLIQFEKKMAVAGVVSVALTLLIGLLLANGITRPLSTIVQAAAALEKGRYDFALDVTGRDEVAFLGKSFLDMRDSLQQHVDHLKSIDQVKSNFIALAGHELRTPLTIITGFNEMIMTGALGEVPDKAKETMRHIQDHLTELNSLVQRILDLSLHEQGLLELHLAPRDLRMSVTGALRARERAFAERRLDIHTTVPEDPAIVRVDEQRIQEALLSLIDNAIRFTPDGGSISVAVSSTEDHVTVKVKDTGIGIPPNELKWIFDKLYEVGDVLHHSSGKYQYGSRGLGLGLSLARALVEAHGGKIEVKSTLGRGSEFTIVLDAADVPVHETMT